MPPILKIFKVQVGTTYYHFKQRPGNYGGQLDTITGVSEAPEEEQDEPDIPVANLAREGKVFRVVCSVQTAAGIKQRKLLISRTNLANAFDALIGEQFPGVGTIISVRIPQKAQFF